MIAPKKMKPPKMATAMIPSRLYLAFASEWLCRCVPGPPTPPRNDDDEMPLPPRLASTLGWPEGPLDGVSVAGSVDVLAGEPRE